VAQLLEGSYLGTESQLQPLYLAVAAYYKVDPNKAARIRT